jgi:hypothetical protein
LLIFRNEPFSPGVIKAALRKSDGTVTKVRPKTIKARRPVIDKETDQHINPQRLRNPQTDQRPQVPKPWDLKQVRSVQQDFQELNSHERREGKWLI